MNCNNIHLNFVDDVTRFLIKSVSTKDKCTELLTFFISKEEVKIGHMIQLVIEEFHVRVE